MTELEATVLAFLRYGAACDAAGIAALLGMDPEEVLAILDDLQRRGLICRRVVH